MSNFLQCGQNWIDTDGLYAVKRENYRGMHQVEDVWV